METIPDRASVHTPCHNFERRPFYDYSKTYFPYYNLQPAKTDVNIQDWRLGFGSSNPPHPTPVADPALQIGGGGRVIPTLRWEGGVPVSKKFFSALRTSVCSKKRGEPGPPGPFPGSATATAPERSSMWVNDLFQFCAVALHSIPDIVNIT